MRGLALFDLTRLFGMPYTLDNGASLGVPIEIQTTLEDHAPERNTVAQCYEQVLKDLNDALGGLTKEKHDAYKIQRSHHPHRHGSRRPAACGMVE